MDKFIDTAVKHYSSGMYMRLAFSVAAHLEQEILLVDEVLAVGDALFQKKCIGQIDKVSKEGRTVLFVSHNMSAVKTLCTRALWIQDGKLAFQGPVQEAIDRYWGTVEDPAEKGQEKSVRRSGAGPARFSSVKISNDRSGESSMFSMGEGMMIEMVYENSEKTKKKLPLVFHIFFNSPQHGRLFTCSTKYTVEDPFFPPSGRLVCHVPKLPLRPGAYSIDVVIKQDREVWDFMEGACKFNVVEGNFYKTGRIPSPNDGMFLVDHRWTHDQGVL
jgi:lipopolysaccharide transport system ATP-binding protein